jgi:hypothetical protein
MWEKLYDFMNFLDRKIQRYPFDLHHTIEMDLDLYNFGREVGFVPENGIIKFKGVTFVLG